MRPRVEKFNAGLLQAVVGKIARHRENFAERIAYGRARREYDTAADFARVSTEFGQRTRFQEHVPRTVGTRVCHAANFRRVFVASGCETAFEIKILEHVRFVDKNLVNAQLVKRNAHVFATFGIHDRFKLLFEIFFCTFKVAYKTF